MNVARKIKIPGFLSLLIPLLFFIFASLLFLVIRETPVNLAPLFSIVVLFVYSRVRRVDNMPGHLDLLLLTGMILVAFFMLSFLPSTIVGYSELMPNVLKVFLFGMCAIGFVMMVTLLFDSLELSMLFSILVSQLGGAIEGGGLSIGVSLFCGSVVASMMTYRLRARSQIVKSVIVSVITFFGAYMLESTEFLFLLAPLNYQFLLFTITVGVIASVLMIVILPVIVGGFLYVFEYVFKVVTNISLLELSDFNHPALKRLLLEAPGTYQHSLVVANLSEIAAEAIGANTILARVGGYYHDIGKLEKAEYFTENQLSRHNAHDDLKPSMSKLIILNHVKEGVELGKKYRLNPRIVDFITQHHGTTVMQYFYYMAKKSDEDGEQTEEDYRYPGPRPQTKEIAIVSLADTVEAVSRTLDDPSPARIEELVRETVRKRFTEGELDDANITMRELNAISESFIRVLNASFHTRVNYPKDESDEDRDSRPPKNR
jgi:putative nucleotidyltransferase with HDIG domain